MISLLLAANLVVNCPDALRSALEGVTWTKADEKAVTEAEAKCKEMGFECVIEIRKYDDTNFMVSCGFEKEKFREGGRK